MTKVSERASARASENELKVYSRNFALDVFGGKDRSERSHVVNLKIAARKTDGNGYAWDTDALSFQVSEKEVAPCAAVLLGFSQSAELVHLNNGIRKEVHLFINPVTKDEPGNAVSRSCGLTMRTQNMNSARGVKIEADDRIRLAVFFFRVFMRNNGGIAQEVLYRMLEDVYGQTYKPQALHRADQLW